MKSLKDYFDKIYVLNYIEGKGRREAMIKQLKHFGLLNDVEFHYGMPFGKIKAMAPKIQEIADKMPYDDLGRITGIGCSFNHYSAIKTAYETGANSVLIIEDDVCLRNDLDLIYEYFDNIPKDWDYLYLLPIISFTAVNVHDLELFRTSQNKWINLKDFHIGQLHTSKYRYNHPWVGSGAYAMNRKAMELYIDIFENSLIIINSDMIEYFYHNISQSPLNMYTTNIRLFACPKEFNNLKYEDKNYIIPEKTDIPTSIDVDKDHFSYYELPENEMSFIYPA